MGRCNQVTIRAGQEHRQKFVELLEKASYKHPVWRVWDDTIFMCAAAMSQPFQWVQEREDEYLRRIGRYDKEIQALFPQMFGELTLAFEQEGCTDILGDMYMQLNLGDHWKGQYFTPSYVCELMAKCINIDFSDIKKKGYITVNDPCCGAGGMLIAYAKTALDADVNYQNEVLFVGQDIDAVVARMCFISMSLLGMPGYVIVGNTLLNDTENWDYWYTPLYFLNNFHMRERWRMMLEIMTAGPKPAAEVSTATETNELKQLDLVI